ncbi:MAG: OprD family outer membrane porin [Sulfuricurvum sp.]|nr:OprD family outer membrane porin [Sulfuricurvum sp.]
MKFIALSALCALSLQAADGLDTWFKEGHVSGNVKYYYIDTTKDGGTPGHSSGHANAIGGQLSYVTGSLYGLKLGATFMTTNPFALPNDPGNVDTSIIGRDNGVRLDGNANGVHSDDGFTVLGEVYGQYNRDNYELWYGRKVIETPLIDAKEVRMLPSSIEGGMASVKLTPEVQLSAGYIDKFKQRTSDRFTNIVKHALGSDTLAITGHEDGYIVPVSVSYKNAAVSTRVYDYYAPDFMNSIYADATFTNKLAGGVSYSASAQAIAQDSVGNADSAAATAIMGGAINAQEVGAKVSATYQDTTLMAACTHVLSNSGDHDSLVLPWDGTPLYTNMITSNDLFISNYGQGLKSDTAYIGGTTGVKFGASQIFEIAGIKGFSAGLSYAHYTNGRFPKSQEDINGELGYGIGSFSLALKGMWVSNNTSASAKNVITQNDTLTQYRVIANYKF